MATPQESNTIQVYFKIPFTDITTTCVVDTGLTTTQFINYVNVEVRNKLNINSRYDIEIVEAGNPGGEFASYMEARDDQTLLQRFNIINKLIAFYARPVIPITREFIRQNDYSN
jgi:hypothetical protein